MWSSSKVSNEFLRTGRDSVEGNPPGIIRAAFVLWATQLSQVRVHSDEFATGTVRSGCCVGIVFAVSNVMVVADGV